MNPRTFLITGSSRGIGLSLALHLARTERANIIVCSKTVSPHPKLPGTIYTAADEIERAGGRALPIQVDVRDEEQVEKAVRMGADKFGGIDGLVNNASAINLKSVEETSTKSYDLINSVNARGTFLLSKHVHAHLLRSASSSRNPHILTLSPPLSTLSTPTNLSLSPAYALSKGGMTILTLGLAHSPSLRGKVGVNTLWPYTLIQTDALRLVKGEGGARARSPEIVAEAAGIMLRRDGRTYTAREEVDECVLRGEGWDTKRLREFSVAGVDEEQLEEDLFLDDGIRNEVRRLRRKEGDTTKDK